MSKFFGGRSDSESSSSEEVSSDEEVQVQQKKPQRLTAAAILFSDDESDDKRIVRSAKVKRYEALYNIIKGIRNSKKIKDFNKMLTSYEELLKAFDKAKPVIAKEENGVTPRFYIRILVEMEDLINETWEDSVGRKNMSKVNGKSLGALRQKLRKYIRENLDDDVAKFRENPDADDDEGEGDAAEEEVSDAEDGDGFSRAKSEEKEVVRKVKKASPDGDDDDSDDWMSSSDSDSGDTDEELQTTSVYTRDMFLKKVEDPEKAAKKKEKNEEKLRLKEDRRKEREEMKRAEDSEEEGEQEEGWTKVRTAAKIAMFSPDAEITIELVIKKLAEIMAGRGKKKTNRKEQIELLNELATISEKYSLGPGIHMKIKFSVIAALFDYNPKLSDAMKGDSWEKCMGGVEELLDMLEEQGENMTTGEHILEDSEQLDVAPYKVRGCYLTSVERLDEEFVKVLKACDAHSNEYVERLKDEPRVVKILEKVDKMIQKTGSASEICRIYLKRVEHVYFKFDPEVLDQKAGKLELEPGKETSYDMMDRLCKYIYSKDNTDRLRTSNFRPTTHDLVIMGIPGAFGDTKTPTEDQVAVLNALKAEVEASVGQTFETFEAVSLVTQVVAGTNLRFKIKVGEGASDFCHVTVFQPLPHTGNAPSLTSAEMGKSADDAL